MEQKTNFKEQVMRDFVSSKYDKEWVDSLDIKQLTAVYKRLMQIQCQENLKQIDKPVANKEKYEQLDMFFHFGLGKKESDI